MRRARCRIAKGVCDLYDCQLLNPVEQCTGSLQSHLRSMRSSALGSTSRICSVSLNSSDPFSLCGACLSMVFSGMLRSDMLPESLFGKQLHQKYMRKQRLCHSKCSGKCSGKYVIDFSIGTGHRSNTLAETKLKTSAIDTAPTQIPNHRWR